MYIFYLDIVYQNNKQPVANKCYMYPFYFETDPVPYPRTAFRKKSLFKNDIYKLPNFNVFLL